MEQPINQFNSTPKNNSLLLPVIIAVILTAVIVGGGTYWWANQKQTELNNEIVSLRTQVDQLKQVSTPTTTPAPTPSPKDETASWKTYQNDKYLVEVRYPNNMSVIGPEYKIYDQSGKVSKTGLSLIIRETRYINQVEGEAPALIITDRKRISQSKETKVFRKEDTIIFNDVPVIPIYFQVNGKNIAAECELVNFSEQQKEEFVSLCNQILSTFKFLQ